MVQFDSIRRTQKHKPSTKSHSKSRKSRGERESVFSPRVKIAADGAPPNAMHDLAKSIHRLSVQGNREYQEDRFVIQPVAEEYLLMCVMDGHGTQACSQFCSDRFASIVSDAIAKQKQSSDKRIPKPTIEALLTRCIQQLVKSWDEHSLGLEGSKALRFPRKNAAFFQNNPPTDDNASGCTLSGALINVQQSLVHVFNLGDSRTVLGLHDGRVVQTLDASIDKYTKIANKGRFKVFIEDERLQGELAMSASIGDNAPPLAGVVDRSADIFTVPFKKGKCRVLVGTDGWWDHIGSSQSIRYSDDDIVGVIHDLQRDEELHDNTTVLFFTF